MYVHHYCACAALRANVASWIRNQVSPAESAFSACIGSDRFSPAESAFSACIGSDRFSPAESPFSERPRQLLNCRGSPDHHSCQSPLLPIEATELQNSAPPLVRVLSRRYILSVECDLAALQTATSLTLAPQCKAFYKLKALGHDVRADCLL